MNNTHLSRRLMLLRQSHGWQSFNGKSPHHWPPLRIKLLIANHSAWQKNNTSGPYSGPSWNFPESEPENFHIQRPVSALEENWNKCQGLVLRTAICHKGRKPSKCQIIDGKLPSRLTDTTLQEEYQPKTRVHSKETGFNQIGTGTQNHAHWERTKKQAAVLKSSEGCWEKVSPGAGEEETNVKGGGDYKKNRFKLKKVSREPFWRENVSKMDGQLGGKGVVCGLRHRRHAVQHDRKNAADAQPLVTEWSGCESLPAPAARACSQGTWIWSRVSLWHRHNLTHNKHWVKICAVMKFTAMKKKQRKIYFYIQLLIIVWADFVSVNLKFWLDLQKKYTTLWASPWEVPYSSSSFSFGRLPSPRTCTRVHTCMSISIVNVLGCFITLKKQLLYYVHSLVSFSYWKLYRTQVETLHLGINKIIGVDVEQLRICTKLGRT